MNRPAQVVSGALPNEKCPACGHEFPGNVRYGALYGDRRLLCGYCFHGPNWESDPLRALGKLVAEQFFRLDKETAPKPETLKIRSPQHEQTT